jgi:hypothetical protein
VNNSPSKVETIDVTDDTSQSVMSSLKVVLPLNKLSMLVMRLTFHSAMGPYSTEVNLAPSISACNAALVRKGRKALEGVIDGWMEGISDGEITGPSDGLIDGPKDGLLDTEGPDEGDPEGLTEKSEGLVDGSLDGFSEAAMDGCEDGMELGTRQTWQ